MIHTLLVAFNLTGGIWSMTHEELLGNEASLMKGFNLRWHEEKLYELLLPRSALLDEAVYRYLYTNKIPSKVLPHTNKLVVYFADKSEAKSVRDLVNDRFRFKNATDKRTADWTELTTVQPGPDNHRYRGTVR